MNNSSFNDVILSSDRYKLFILLCQNSNLDNCLQFIKSKNISPINIGFELAKYTYSLNDYRFINIDIYDFTSKLLENNKVRLQKNSNEVVAIYNLGILSESTLELNAIQLLKEFSKSSSLIIIWENQFELPGKLCWSTQKQKINFDFSDIPLKKLEYEI